MPTNRTSVLVAVLLLALAGCGPREETFEIDDIRVRPPPPALHGEPLAPGTPRPSADAEPPAGLPPGVDLPDPSRRPSLTWDAPEGWARGPRRSKREVTFVPPGAQMAELYVVVARGRVRSALDGWRTQMGKEPLGEDAFAALSRLEVLGREGILIEIEGDYRGGMGGRPIPDAALMGFVVERDRDAVFVKMIGPRDEVLAHRHAFEAFCRSLAD